MWSRNVLVTILLLTTASSGCFGTDDRLASGSAADQDAVLDDPGPRPLVEAYNRSVECTYMGCGRPALHQGPTGELYLAHSKHSRIVTMHTNGTFSNLTLPRFESPYMADDIVLGTDASGDVWVVRLTAQALGPLQVAQYATDAGDWSIHELYLGPRSEGMTTYYVGMSAKGVNDAGQPRIVFPQGDDPVVIWLDSGQRRNDDLLSTVDVLHSISSSNDGVDWERGNYNGGWQRAGLTGLTRLGDAVAAEDEILVSLLARADDASRDPPFAGILASNDRGETFTTRYKLPADASRPSGAPPALLRLADGTLLLADVLTDRIDIHVSADQGRSWTHARSIEAQARSDGRVTLTAVNETTYGVAWQSYDPESNATRLHWRGPLGVDPDDNGEPTSERQPLLQLHPLPSRGASVNRFEAPVAMMPEHGLVATAIDWPRQTWSIYAESTP